MNSPHRTKIIHKDKEVPIFEPGDLVIFIKDYKRVFGIPKGSKARVLKSDTGKYALDIEGHGFLAWVERDYIKLVAALRWE